MRPSPLLAVLACLGLGCTLDATTVWVSPTGADANEGSEHAPVASPARAAALVREARRAHPTETVTVLFAPGDYLLIDTLRLSGADSGSPTAPVTWRAAERGRVRLLGARPVPPAALHEITDPAVLARLPEPARGHVRELDLAALGIRHAGPLADYVRDTPDLCVLFADGKRLPLSRWPNGEYGYTTMKRVLSSGSLKGHTPDGGTFEYTGDEPARWLTAVSGSGVWLRGFWRVPWVAETLRVARIDPAAHTITFAASTENGIGSKYSPVVNGTRVGDGREAWYALNLLEEIDQPGEWCIDAPRRKLYVWPPSATATLALADNERPLVAFDGASHVLWRDLTLAQHLGDAVTINGGVGVQIAGCRIESIARRGVVIRGGSAHEVRSCDFAEIGLSAMNILGGDRRTLRPARHQIVNNDIFRVALSSPVPAVIAGIDAKHQEIVGCTIAHNRIHDASYGGITFGGNDNVLEWNEIYRVGLDGGDLGAFYTTGGWTARGNVVRCNFIHHAENANAIYMDDGACGLWSERNLIYRTESGLFIGGGHDNLAHGNLLVRCTRAFHVDDRGVARKYVATDPRLRGDLNSVPYTTPPWSERYPELLSILASNPAVPRGNRLTENTIVACGTVARRNGTKDTLAGFELANNPTIADAAVFADPEALDFSLRNPAALGTGERPDLDVSHYGLQVDAFRPSVPPRDLEQLRRGNTKRRAFDSQRDVEAYR